MRCPIRARPARSPFDPAGWLCYLPPVPKRKLSRKELKQPDEFVGFWTHASERSAGYVASHTPGAHRLADDAGDGDRRLGRHHPGLGASRAYAAATRSRASSASPPASCAARPTTTPPPDDGLPHFKTDKERAEAALKELDAFVRAVGQTRCTPRRWLQRGSLLLDLDRARRGRHGLPGDPERQPRRPPALPGRRGPRLRLRAPRGTWPGAGGLRASWATTSAGRTASTRTAPPTTRRELPSCEATRRTRRSSIERCWTRTPPPRCATRSRIGSPCSR